MLVKLFLGANALVVGLIGLAYLYDPDIVLARYGLESGSPGMDNMLRAAYGGLFVGISGVLAWGTVHETRRSDAIGLLILFMGSQEIGRATSTIAAGSPPVTIMGLFYYECAAVAVGFALWWRNTSR